ncbi:hypothetical protein L7F22_013260 [Adiantum nelumboides]|nr:hypothetical protein [Adiantum nelumboides]
MDDEMDALVKNDTWDLVCLPSGKKAIGSKWVYKVKCKSDGSVERYKARLVAKGYAQTKGLEYDETFSPVAKMTTVRLVIAMASMFGWKLRQMDVNNAFLNGDLEEEVYMIQPEGYQHPEFPYYVCRLKKALYGLKQAPRAWCEKITRFLKKIGFKQSTADHSLFLKHVDGEIVVIVIYVDDLILTGSHDEQILDVKNSLLREFNMKDLGELRYFLGIEIVDTLSGIWMIQRQYALDMLENQGLLKEDVMLGTALTNMYAKCGVLLKACMQGAALRKMLGHDQEALHYFQQMQSVGLSPDAITYACILHTCGFMQDVEMGKKFTMILQS